MAGSGSTNQVAAVLVALAGAALHGLHQLLGDRQVEVAAVLAGGGVAQRPEGAGPQRRAAEFEAHLAGPAGGLQGNVDDQLAGLRVAYEGAHQVGEHLAQPPGVALHARRQVGVHVGDQLHLLLFRPLAEQIHRAHQQLVGVQGLAVDVGALVGQL
jgi:hypothetical protein